VKQPFLSDWWILYWWTPLILYFNNIVFLHVFGNEKEKIVVFNLANFHNSPNCQINCTPNFHLIQYRMQLNVPKLVMHRLVLWTYVYIHTCIVFIYTYVHMYILKNLTFSHIIYTVRNSHVNIRRVKWHLDMHASCDKLVSPCIDNDHWLPSHCVHFRPLLLIIYQGFYDSSKVCRNSCVKGQAFQNTVTTCVYACRKK